jgi:hypothetical protein
MSGFGAYRLFAKRAAMASGCESTSLPGQGALGAIETCIRQHQPYRQSSVL